MLRTYEGILEGDRVRWVQREPPVTDRPLRVHITVLEEEAKRKDEAERWPRRSLNWRSLAHSAGLRIRAHGSVRFGRTVSFLVVTAKADAPRQQSDYLRSRARA